MLQEERTRRTRLQRAIPDAVDRVDLGHGVTVGDATAETAVLWTRTDEPAVVHVEYSPDDSFDRATRAIPCATDAADDHTVNVRLTDLQPDTEYHYRVWALAGNGAAEFFSPPEEPETGRFRTAPAPDDDAPVSFVWGGDTYGQGRAPPYQAPAHMTALDPDFFLYLGDTIYADCPSPALPDADPETVDDYRSKYREMRETATNLRELLTSTGTVAIWDDHEVANDWAGTTEPRLPQARRAFREYWPVDDHESVTGDDDDRLYRSFRWGADLELFVLDTRQYRDENELPDCDEDVLVDRDDAAPRDRGGKTMLGDEQREWLKRSLAATDATFAMIASSVSLSSPSSAPDARDSWADGDAVTGFERELRELVEFVRTDVDSTVVWLTGDRHFARVASFDVDHDGRPDTYEVMASPIGAAPREPGQPDRTFAPLVHYEEGGKYELGEFYNFGHVQVDDGTLQVSIHDKVGDERCRVTIDADGDGWPDVQTAADDGDLGDGPLMTVLKRSFDALADRWT